MDIQHGRIYQGWLKGRDASFETYVKGTMNFGSSAGASREQNGYMFYSKEDISKIGFSSSSTPTSLARNRNPSDQAAEEELFTYEEGSSSVVEFALQWEGKTGWEIYLESDREHSDSPPWLFNYVASRKRGTNSPLPFVRGNWCAMFVSYCYDSVGLIDAIGGAETQVLWESDIKSTLGDEYWAPAGTEPEPGWLIYFDYPNTDYSVDHVAMVVSCENGMIKTIGGNQGGNGWQNNIVSIVSYSITDPDIYGYLIPKQ